MDAQNHSANSQFLFNKTLPYFDSSINESLVLKNYFYDCTNIRLDEPLTLVTHAMPYLKHSDHFANFTNHDITGYFDVENDPQTFTYIEEDHYTPEQPIVRKVDLSEENFANPYYILKYFITGDAELEIDTELLSKWNFYHLMTQKLHIRDANEGPKILIFHTHAREKYKDGKSVVDVGEKLEQVFEKHYGIQTMHVTSEFYADDTENVTGAYEIMEKSITKILKENPSIEIVIDIHRDGVAENVRLVTPINQKNTAKIMFVNGLCMNRDVEGNLVEKELKNPYVSQNLAFSLQAQAMAYKYYPNLAKKVYLKEYRYSLHMKPMSLLVEIGAQTNTGQEAINAAEPLANIIAKVIEKD
jgi:stage II sporulation protein P